MPRKVIDTVAAEPAITLPIDVNAFSDCMSRVLAEPQIIVITADEKHAVVDSGAGHHRRHQRNRLGRKRPNQVLRRPAHNGLRGHYRYADRDQRQHHGERISINDKQDDQDHEHDGGLDHMHIADTDVRQVVAGGRGAGQVCRQRGSRDGLFDDVGDPAVRPRATRVYPRRRRAPWAGTRLYDPCWSWPRAGPVCDEILQHDDVARVRPQLVGRGAVGDVVGGAQSRSRRSGPPTGRFRSRTRIGETPRLSVGS